MALTDNLVVFYELEEASGSRVDQVAAKNLTDNNTVTSGTGKVGNAALFTAANSEYLSIADDPVFDFGSGDYSLNVWFNRNSSGQQWLLGKRQDANNVWWLSIEDISHVIVSGAYAGGVLIQNVQSANSHTVTGAWSMVTIVMDRDSTSGTRLYFNGADETDGTPTVGVTNIDNTGALNMGRWGGGGLYWNGLLDQVGIWKRAITGAEVTTLYNSGAGLSYAAMVGVISSVPGNIGRRFKVGDGMSRNDQAS